MSSEFDPSLFVQPLPQHPNLEMQQKRAKQLLRAALRGESAALQRIRVLHPTPPAPASLTLADAQLVIARGYGFDSWPALRRRIDALTASPIEQFVRSLRARDPEQARALLAAHADVRAAINRPIGDFGGRPASMARKDLALLDVLIEYGADLNLKSEWWAGPFGLLEFEITPAEAAPLIARGAIADIFAAAHLGMFDRVRELIAGDPSLVSARGGDGRTALHCATTVEIARFLLAAGADIDARDVDHESTAAQYLVREAPAVTRLLVERGAWFDIFIAVGLRDAALVERCRREDPEALEHRTGQGLYTTVHRGRPATSAQIGRHRGDIYRWVFGHHLSALDVARMLDHDDILRLLLRHASPAQQLLAACAAGDRAAADAVISRAPAVVASLLPQQMRLIADRAYANDSAAVLLMVDLGFDTRVPGPERWEAIRWEAFLGNAVLTGRLLQHAPPINVPDASYGGTILGNCLYGALHGWAADTGDFVTTVRLLLEAGEHVKPSSVPTGLDELDAVLRAHLARPLNPPA